MDTLSELAYDDILAEVAQAVFATMLDIQLERGDAPSEPLSLVTTVDIAGATTGTVSLALSSRLIHAAAAKMFKLEPAEITDLDEQEVACELANMVGGNLKSILPGPASLSLPRIVAAGPDSGSCAHRPNNHATTLVATEGQVCVALSLEG